MLTFSPWHIPALFVATVHVFGGLSPLVAPARAIRAFGLPDRFAGQRAAQLSFRAHGSAVSVLGALQWLLYLRGNFEAVDAVMTLLMWMWAVESSVLWTEGLPQKAVTRAAMGLTMGVCGLLGFTSRG